MARRHARHLDEVRLRCLLQHGIDQCLRAIPIDSQIARVIGRLDRTGKMQQHVGTADQPAERGAIFQRAEHDLRDDSGIKPEIQRFPPCQQAQVTAARSKGCNHMAAEKAGGAGDGDGQRRRQLLVATAVTAKLPCK